MQAGFQRTEVEDSEGIIVKALEAPYQLGRPPSSDPSWIKWKRDYQKGGWEVDVLIVGGMYAHEGASAGLAKFVCALKGGAGVPGMLFCTFVRVYTGLAVRPAWLFGSEALSSRRRSGQALLHVRACLHWPCGVPRFALAAVSKGLYSVARVWAEPPPCSKPTAVPSRVPHFPVSCVCRP